MGGWLGLTLIIRLSLSSNWTELDWTETELGNIVMVFSNSTHAVKELARDRWNIFSIENDELVKRQISKSWPPVVLTSNKNQSNGFKKKNNPQDSDHDSDSDY